MDTINYKVISDDRSRHVDADSPELAALKSGYDGSVIVRDDHHCADFHVLVDMDRSDGGRRAEIKKTSLSAPVLDIAVSRVVERRGDDEVPCTMFGFDEFDASHLFYSLGDDVPNPVVLEAPRLSLRMTNKGDKNISVTSLVMKDGLVKTLKTIRLHPRQTQDVEYDGTDVIVVRRAHYLD